ncbi:MAG: NupC/NupG family nucleoside CNT transporter [bacterium]|nr:NupC/NupG family nucleoside CNT transporter [bacterium]
MMLRGMSALGLVVFLGIAWLMSERRRDICWRTVISGVALQLLLCVFVLKTTVGLTLIEWIQAGFVFVINAHKAGAEFVFGSLATQSGFLFFITVTCTLIFFSALMSILYHWRIMPYVVAGMAWLMQRVMRTGGRESLVAAAEVFLGMTESPLCVRPYLPTMSRSELMAMMVAGLATIAGSVMAVYIGFGISAGHLLTASVMSAPGALVIAKMIIPAEPGAILSEIPRDLALQERAHNTFDALMIGARDGLFLSLNICAMLIAMVSLVALVNALLSAGAGWCGGSSLTLQKVFGYVGWPLALLMGVPPRDAHAVGELLSTKVFLTELMAYRALAAQLTTLSPRAVTIATYACCGFANFGSIAILLGAYSTLAPTRRADVAGMALKALVGGTLASFCAAAIAGCLL